MKKTFKVVMLPTERFKDAKLGFINDFWEDKKLGISEHYDTGKRNINNNIVFKPQHLHIISDDEIKEGDWFFDSKGYFDELSLYQLGKDNKDLIIDEGCHKIIATTDKSLKLPQIPESFIQAYIRAYNEGRIITEVDLETTNGNLIYPETENSFDNAYYEQIVKTRSDNTVIVHQSKLYTKDEVIQLIRTFDIKMGRDIKTLKFDKWIKENL